MGKTVPNALLIGVCGWGSSTVLLPCSPSTAAGGGGACGDHFTCLMRAVSSCTRLYTDLSSRINFAIFVFACITVV